MEFFWNPLGGGDGGWGEEVLPAWNPVTRCCTDRLATLILHYSWDTPEFQCCLNECSLLEKQHLDKHVLKP